MIALLANPEQSGHRAEGHPERPERVAAILEAIRLSGLGLTPELASPAVEALIHRVHDPSYIASLDGAAAAGGGYMDPDTYLTPASMVAAPRSWTSTFTTVTARNTVLRMTRRCSTPPPISTRTIPAPAPRASAGRTAPSSTYRSPVAAVIRPFLRPGSRPSGRRSRPSSR